MLRIYLFCSLTTVAKSYYFVDEKANTVWKGDRPPFPTYYPPEFKDSLEDTRKEPDQASLYKNLAQFLGTDHSLNQVKEKLKNLPFKDFQKKRPNVFAKGKQLKKNFTNNVKMMANHTVPSSVKKEVYNNFKDKSEDLKNVDITPDHLTDNPIHKDSDSQRVKNKIVSLANETIEDLDSQISIVDEVHKAYKSNILYRLGYVVSYINKTNEEVTDLMRYINKNKDTWNALQLLNAYEQIKKAKDFLSQSLLVLQQFRQPSPITPQKYPHSDRPHHHDKSRGGIKNDPIAWSYYDDSI